MQRFRQVPVALVEQYEVIKVRIRHEVVEDLDEIEFELVLTLIGLLKKAHDGCFQYLSTFGVARP